MLPFTDSQLLLLKTEPRPSLASFQSSRKATAGAFPAERAEIVTMFFPLVNQPSTRSSIKEPWAGDWPTFLPFNRTSREQKSPTAFNLASSGCPETSNALAKPSFVPADLPSFSQIHMDWAQQPRGRTKAAKRKSLRTNNLKTQRPQGLELGDEVLDHMSVDVGQAIIATLETVSQLLVIESQQVHPGSLEVVNVDGILGHAEP